MTVDCGAVLIVVVGCGDGVIVVVGCGDGLIVLSLEVAKVEWQRLFIQKSCFVCVSSITRETYFALMHTLLHHQGHRGT